jgi:hypothetical protein
MRKPVLALAALLLLGPACGDSGSRRTLPTEASAASPAEPADVQVPDDAGPSEPFKLLVHCGLSFPLRYEDRLWLPVDPELRRTINPPPGFGGDENYDHGTIQTFDDDTLVYTSSEGVEVEYEPTDQPQGGCD